ncbi:transglycosylase SLT domain-containing protein [Sandarakinorhabdus sp.]|uniref:transglycosylase SLT domain-containing protein n=1 Tax=Sandarakinorhabdus sp. TaxID=1916663 RepID=UPI003F6F6F0A
MTSAIALNPARTGIIAAVEQAAQRTGVDFSYLLANARAESGLNPGARANTSSASGLFQFTDATWLGVVARHGEKHGLGWAADALRNGASRAMKDTILSLRHNAEAAAAMAGEFTRDNAAALEKSLGRAAGSADLYLAAFFGVGGAIKFLGAMAANPGAAAANLLPAAAAANRSTFFHKDGSARSLTEVHDLVASRINRHMGSSAAISAGKPLPPTGRISPSADPALAASRAKLAYLVLAAMQ